MSQSRLVSAANGMRPVSISYSVTPMANTSVRSSTWSPVTCSGAMYFTVPAIVPAIVSDGAVRAVSGRVWRASPKSSSFTPCAVRKTLAGLRSRWINPTACNDDTASINGRITAMASASDIGPRPRRSDSGSPSSSSITRNS